MAAIHADNTGVLIAFTKDDMVVMGAAVSLTLDAALNSDLLEDIRYNGDHYRLLPGPLLQKDGVAVPVDTTIVPTSIRRAVQILTAQEALIASAANLGDVRVILEQNRTILRRLLLLMGE